MAKPGRERVKKLFVVIGQFDREVGGRCVAGDASLIRLKVLALRVIEG